MIVIDLINNNVKKLIMKIIKNSDTALIGCGYWGTNIAFLT